MDTWRFWHRNTSPMNGSEDMVLSLVSSDAHTLFLLTAFTCQLRTRHNHEFPAEAHREGYASALSRDHYPT